MVEKLWEVTQAATPIITSDVGQHQMWAAQYYHFDKPRRWINSGGLGTMGVGLPVRDGHPAGQPGREVACITGEGRSRCASRSSRPACSTSLPIKIVKLNNRYLGMVRQWQQIDYGGRYCRVYMDALPDFVKLAEAYGHVGMQIEKPARRRARAARGVRAQGPTGVPGLPHRPDRERLADGARAARASPRCCSVRRAR